jgi:hypothetical protein
VQIHNDFLSSALTLYTVSVTSLPGSQGNGNNPITTKEEKVLNGCADTSVISNVLENGIVAEEVRSEREREKNPPKAMVKPQVLTHVIEGFVIQEGTLCNYDFGSLIAI